MYNMSNFKNFVTRPFWGHPDVAAIMEIRTAATVWWPAPKFFSNSYDPFTNWNRFGESIKKFLRDPITVPVLRTIRLSCFELFSYVFQRFIYYLSSFKIPMAMLFQKFNSPMAILYSPMAILFQQFLCTSLGWLSGACFGIQFANWFC